MSNFINRSQIYKPFSDLSKTVIFNSIASVLLAITVLVFTLIKTSLVANIYGISSIGFLGIAVGILPYISSTHGGASYVSRYNLYDKVYAKKYDDANQTIANLKVQYYFFGSIYCIITIILSFAFPFFFSSDGSIVVSNTINNVEFNTTIEWYESSLFILSNCVEAISNYFIIPISIILFFVIKKSYITNSINTIIAVIANLIIIALLLMQKFDIININFVIMNTIITTIIGLRILILVIILKPIRTKKIHWYKKVKINNKRISKNMVVAIITEYFKQFNSDLYSVVFIVLTVVLNKNDQNINHNNNGIILMHDNHNHGGFETGGVYYIFLFLITASYEIVHSIVDSAIPSMADHLVVNKKIHRTFFNRYNALVIYIATYCISTYLFTVGFSSIEIMDIEHLYDSEIILLFIIILPFFIDIRTTAYDHIMPIYGDFKKIMIYVLIKTAINVITTAIFGCILGFTLGDEQIMTAIFVAIVSGWTISSLIYFILNRNYVNKLIDTQEKIKWWKKIKQNAYIIIACIAMLIIYIMGDNKVFNLEKNIRNIGHWSYLIIAGIAIINFPITIFSSKFTNKSEFNYYLKEFICLKNHYQEKYKNQKKL